MDRQTFVSHAQNGEDVVLWRALGHVRDGRYVDVGAADPEVDSVTKAFVDRGWRGIDIEPVPELAQRLREARPDNEVIEAATTLDAVCEASGLLHGDLHFLKIDVDGLDDAVLGSISLATWRPWVVVAASTGPNSSVPAHETWEPLLTRDGYTLALFDGLNRYYVSADHPELIEPLSYPACVLDGFQRADHVQLRRELQESRSETSRWRTAAIGGFAESTSVAQAAQTRMLRLEKRAKKLEATLEATREKLSAARQANRTLQRRLDQLGSHLEVRMRRRASTILRRARGKS